MEKITLSTNKLMYQAPETIVVYLTTAIKHINAQFGDKDFAAKSPELVGYFVQACALDFYTAIIAKTYQELIESINEIRKSIAEINENLSVTINRISQQNENPKKW